MRECTAIRTGSSWLANAVAAPQGPLLLAYQVASDANPGLYIQVYCIVSRATSGHAHTHWVESCGNKDGPVVGSATCRQYVSATRTADGTTPRPSDRG